MTGIKNLRALSTAGLSLIVVVVAISIKLSLTNSALLPGIDGAYYWVQVRSLMETGKLAFDDLPLIFWIQAGISWLVGDIPLGVRISDAVLPALSAIPIYLMTRNARNVFLPAISIFVALVNPFQLFVFTGNFVKNEASIPLIFTIGMILFFWGKWKTKTSVIALAAAMAILALAHFGTLLIGLLLVGIWLILQMRKQSRQFWLFAAGGSLVIVGLSLGSLALFVPARFERLFEFLVTPDSAFTLPSLERLAGLWSPSGTNFAILFGQISAVILLAIFLWLRKSLAFEQVSLVTAGIASGFILSSPFIGFEWQQRVCAMAFVPLIIAALTLIQASPPKAITGVIAALGLVLTSASLISGVNAMIPPLMPDAQYSKFETMAKKVDLNENSIVVAQHGLEFLTAWVLKTHVVQDQFYAEVDRTKYKTFYVLESEGRGFGFPGGLPAGQKPPYYMPMPGPGKPPIFDKNKVPYFYGKNYGKPGEKFVSLTELALGGEVIYDSDGFKLTKIKN